MGCGAAEVTDLGSVCIVINPRVLSVNRLDLGFFYVINYPILLRTPQPNILMRREELTGIYIRPRLPVAISTDGGSVVLLVMMMMVEDDVFKSNSGLVLL